jgi:hypothetical protein
VSLTPAEGLQYADAADPKNGKRSHNDRVMKLLSRLLPLVLLAAVACAEEPKLGVVRRLFNARLWRWCRRTRSRRTSAPRSAI